MGYTTDFDGEIDVKPPLNAKEIEYLKKFSRTRRMLCSNGPYYINRGGFAGQDHNDSTIIEYNSPAKGQPGLWCKWISSDDGSFIEWDEGEKFYDAAEWMKYLIDHFIGSNPLAKNALSFFEGHVLNGKISAQGEESSDRWDLIVKDNKVFVQKYEQILGKMEAI